MRAGSVRRNVQRVTRMMRRREYLEKDEACPELASVLGATLTFISDELGSTSTFLLLTQLDPSLRRWLVRHNNSLERLPVA